MQRSRRAAWSVAGLALACMSAFAPPVDGVAGLVAAGLPLLSAAPASWTAERRPPRWFANRGFGVVLVLVLVLVLATLLVAMALPALAGPLLLVLAFAPHGALGWLTLRCGLTAGWIAALTGAGVLTLVAAGGDAAGALRPLPALPFYLGSLLAMPLLAVTLTRRLAARERRWRAALDAAGLGVGAWNLRAGEVDLSPRWLALLGRVDQDFGRTIPDFWSQVHADDAVALEHAFAALDASPADPCRAECRMRCADGSWRRLELHARVSERNAAGAPVAVVTTAREIGERRAERERQRLAGAVFEHLHEGLLITDAEHRIVDANPVYSDITGYTRDEVLRTVPTLMRPAATDAAAAQRQRLMLAALAEEGMWRGEVVDQRRNGEPCTLEVTVSVVRGASGAVQNHVLTLTDVTQARLQFEQLQRQVHFDELTRLPNRVRLTQMLDAARAASERDGSLLTVCYLDLDHFKPVNDRYGHAAGDRLLVELASRMRRSLRARAGRHDVLARIGGDEFVLLLRSATLDESRHAVERLLREVCEPCLLGAGVGAVTVTASIGATVFPLDQADADTLLRHADHAMYGAKQAGRNGYLFFDAEYDRRAEARFVALGRVQEALDADEFRLHFQPKVDLGTARVLGMEALLRWQHPEQGVVSPAQFLPLIENTALGVEVGRWVFEQGIDELAGWLRQGLDLTLSINVSARQLAEAPFAEQLAELLQRHPEPVGAHLVLEVLETAALADIDHTCRLMEQCRALGVRFALDDFGTGYSTFTYLKRLPLDMLKIDRSFVTNMLNDSQDLAIVEGVIGLAQTFGCTVVAEGVETGPQARRLMEIGCRIGQGNGIAAAMPADAVVGWVRDYRGTPLEPPAALPAFEAADA